MSRSQATDRCKDEEPLPQKDELSLFKVVGLNCAVIVGIVVGFWSSPKSLSAQMAGCVAVFFFAFFNLLFLVAPLRLAQRSADTQSNIYREAWDAIAERPLISTLVLLQLWAVARCLGTVIGFGRAYASPQVASQNLQGRMLLACAVFVVVGLLWLAGAVGIWRTQAWAWWPALVLNGLAAGITIVIQLFKLDQFLIDPVAVTMVVLLMLPNTRRLFRTPVLPVELPNS